MRLKKGEIEKISVRGHADSAPYGQDLVCAAASAIMFGVMNAADVMFPDACSFEVKPNQLSISADKPTPSLQTCLQTALVQFKTVEESSPEHIRIQEKEV